MVTTQENQELVQGQFDLYMKEIDEQFYLKFGNEMDELEKQIESSWWSLRYIK